MTLTRRNLLTAFTALGAVSSLAGRPALASDTPIDLEWSDLIPDTSDQPELPDVLGGVVQHGQISPPLNQSSIADVTTAYNGKTVRLPGFVVPLDFTGVGVTSLLLVPYVGACIHVPPPPPNQLVYVTTDQPHEFTGLFQPVWVTGALNSGVSITELAEVGYSITNGTIEPYEWN